MAVMNAAAEVLLGINESSEDQIKSSTTVTLCVYDQTLYIVNHP